MIGMGSVSVTNIKNGKDGTPGIGISNTYVQYCYGGSATDPPGEYLKDENGILLIDETGKFLTNGEWQTDVPAAQPGLYLWSRTVTTFDDGNESYMYSIGREGLGILNEKKQFYLSSSLTELKDGYWSDVEPYPIPEGKYLFGRYEFIMTDGSIQYSDAYYENVLSGVINKTDDLEKSITMKIWETDIDAKISDFDSEYQIRDRITTQELNVDGIWTSITDQNTKTITKPDGTVVTTMASRVHEVEETAVRYGRLIEGTDSVLGQTSTLAEQTANHLSWIVKSGTSASNFTLTDRTASLTADYINANGLVEFRALNSAAQSRITKPETLLKTWTGDANLATTTINGGYIRSHTIVADHLATNALMSFGQQNQQTGEYTGGYLRDKNATFSTRGSFFDMENGNIFTPTFSIINTIPTGETNLKTGGFFKGNVVADTGNIGGWTIDGNLLYSTAKTPGSTSMILTPTGVSSSTSIGGSTGSKSWSLTIKDKFGVTTDGYMYATNANISGKITSTEGSIGGININNIGIYTGTKSAANSTQDGFLISNTGAIYLGAYNSTRNSTAFQVNPNGYVKAYNLDALGGNVGGWTITDTMLYYNSATSSNPTRPSTTSIILSPRGNTPNPVVDVGGSGSDTKNWGMTIGVGFGVTTTGELWCNQAHVTGTIFATAGKIGDCEIINGHLNVGSATIDQIDGSKITAGTITADRINITNLGDLSTALGSITSGSMAWSSGSGSSYTAFGVNSNGKLTATSAVISGTLTAGAGSKIGPWVISATSISKNGSDNAGSNYKTNGTGNMYFGDDGLSISDVFYVSNTGKLTSTSATITGSVTATSGSIGNWIIDTAGYLRNSDGSVYISSGLTDDNMYAKFGELQIQDNGNLYTGPYISMQYYNATTHYMSYGQIIEARTPNDLNIVINGTKVTSGTQRTWAQYGSYSGACIAMAFGTPKKIYVKMSDDGNTYTWYDLKACLDAALSGGGGGTSYSGGTGINISGTTIKLDTSYTDNRYALSGHTHSGYAASNHTHSQYLTSSDIGSSAELSIKSLETSGNIKANHLDVIYKANDSAYENSGGMVACLVKQNNGYYRLKFRPSSSKRYKNHVSNISIQEANKILNIPTVYFTYKEGYLSKDDELYMKPIPGFYAEDVEKYVPQAVWHNPDGSVENWKERELLPLMLRVIQDQQKRIEELEKKLIQ